jgi:integrase
MYRGWVKKNCACIGLDYASNCMYSFIALFLERGGQMKTTEGDTRLLTAGEVLHAKPKGSPYTLSDKQGLYLLVKPNGKRLWRYQYRFGGKSKLMALGEYPDVLLPEAREKHQDARDLLKAGQDPMAKRMADKAAQKAEALADDTFQSLALAWLEKWKTTKIRAAGHIKRTERRVQMYLLSAFGKRKAKEITAPEIEIASEKWPPDTAKRCLQIAFQIFAFGVRRSLLTANPVPTEFDFLAERHEKHYARLEMNELPEFFRAVGKARGDLITRLAWKMLSLTVLRTNELLGAQWAEIDLEARVWKVPGARMKGLKAKGETRPAHTVYLPKQADSTLSQLKAHQEMMGMETEFVFASERTGAPLSNQVFLMMLRRAGYGAIPGKPARMTGHGWRGLFSTWAHESGYEHHVIEACIAHSVKGAVEKAYNFAEYAKKRDELMQAWADRLDALILQL